jgi:hypothetical protein
MSKQIRSNLADFGMYPGTHIGISICDHAESIFAYRPLRRQVDPTVSVNVAANLQIGRLGFSNQLGHNRALQMRSVVGSVEPAQVAEEA